MNATDILKIKGIKKTVQRVMIITILQKSEAALTEEDIKQEMGDIYDRTTVYRTLHTLQEAEIIHRITIDNKTVAYAMNELPESTHNHMHFFCKECQEVKCMKEIPSFDYNLPNKYKVD